MGERLIKPYEISVWEEKLIQDGAEYRFEENKLAVIGSDTMTGLNRVYNPVFNKKSNGEKTLSFSLKYKYFDPYSGNSDFVNPFAALLTNERKVKLHYDNKWYEFIIKDHNESSDGLEWTYTCTDAFVLELSKQGYNITFDSELNNNQGTAAQLAKETLKDTDWLVGGVDTFKQLIEEPIYKAVLNPIEGVTIINASGNQDTIPTSETDIYLFYSFVKNQDGKNIQFIIRDDNRDYIIDDKGVITDTNFRITTDLIYDNNCFKDSDNNIIITIEEIETKYHANRLAYGQLNIYDPVMGRTVNRYKVYENNQPGDQEVYEYTDYTYTTSNVVTNYITNGDNFNVLEDGSLQGWNPYTDQSTSENAKPKPVNKLELVTRPELGSGSKLADISTLSQIEGFLKVQTNGHRTVEDNHYCNTVYNSGIENNASIIQSIAKGDQFVFRWRAGVRDAEELDESISDLDCLVPYQNLKLMVAEYTRDESNRFGNYYKHINTNDVILEFTGTPEGPKNNYITGGILRVIEDEDEDDSNNKHEYVIDGVAQSPSTKYIYEDASTHIRYAWDNLTGDFIVIDESSAESYKQYLPYYYLIGTATKGVSSASLSDPKYKIGIFLYTEDDSTPIYIQDIQLTKYIKEADTDEPILIGNVPTATVNATSYYYLKPEVGDEADDIITYTDPKELIDDLYDNTVTIKPLYNDNSEKNLSISASQSNCFNILQTIAETFECWIDLVVEHNERGYIEHDEDGRPRKYVYLREYAGKDNWAGFKYGINLSSIERNVNSDEIVTKLIVDQSQSDLVDEGYISITNAPSNQSGESYIINFDYYYNQGLLNKDEVEADRLKYIEQFAKFNKKLQDANKRRNDLELALTKVDSNRVVYTTLIETAQDTQMDALADFEELIGVDYETYKEIYNGIIDGIDTTETFDEIDREAEKHTFTLDGVPVVDTAITVTIPAWDVTYELVGGEEKTIPETPEPTESTEPTEPVEPTEPTEPQESENSQELILSYNGTSEIILYGIISEQDVTIHYTKDIIDSKVIEDENVLKTLGEIYASSATINNYSGLLSNIDTEYWDLHKQLKGSENYKIKIWTDKDVDLQRHVFVEFNEFLEGIRFTIGTHEETTSLTKKFFDIITNATTFTIEALPKGYRVDETDYTINDNKTLIIKLLSTDTSFGVEDEIEEIQQQKDELTKEFNNKYSHFIQEGTWNSTDYIDAEHYYLDALQVSNTSAQPIVSYTINVVEISEIEGFEWYTFDAGDKTYVEDTEFFGWANKHGVLTPAREEVIVSEVEWHLEEPENNVITVQNYKTRFEDLFQRISAAVQTVQYNEATYAKISTLLDADGTINSDVLLNSLNNISGQKYNLTTDGSITINGNEILIRNLTNRTNCVIINNEGISVSADGGDTWKKVIDGFGINADAVITGSLNTKQIIIGSDDSPSFRWDQAGISAYKTDGTMTDAEGNIIDAYDLKTFVRYDQNGLYGIKDGNSFKPYTLDEIKNNAHFAVTWDGFFIKNSYPGGGRVEITSDNDFRVMNIPEGQTNEQEKIKIGALEWGEGITSPDAPGATVAPTLYGIRINNNAGQTVMKTGDDGNLEITGTLNATAGNFSGLVNVGPSNQNHIIIDGRNGINSPLIKSSNYSDGAGTGWMINKDGDAYFMNITARGAIKTAVFEYAEIQAVGGIFIFRPSSTIRNAQRVEGTDDIKLTLEKPYLFKVGDWCKVSNYIDGQGEPVATAILSNNGLTHVYKVKSIDSNNSRILVLENAYTALTSGNTQVVNNITELIGGALIDMGDKANGDGKVGSSNYGIGVNSSDNTVNLPRRAISLFETVVDETKEPKVSYKYRGILGTLPILQYTGNNPQVSEYYHNYLEGTQGIYTDNMYLGDHDQYITFYEDDNGKKQLRIKANQIMFEIADPEPGRDPWQDIADFDPEGTPGPAGQDAIRVAIESNVGNEFILSQEVATLTCTVYRGAEDVTSQVTKFLWVKNQANGSPDTTWNAAHEDYNLPYIEVTPSEINKKAVFGCRVTLPE